MNQIFPNPRVFISYSWEDDAHRQWVCDLAARLRQDGIDVTLDQWHAAPGDQLPHFMERAVRDNDFVVVICTPKYKLKSDHREGGVGYEGDVMTGEVFAKNNHRKFIPILRGNSWKESAPSWVAGKYYINLNENPYSEKQYALLLATLYGAGEQAPPIGPRPLRYSERAEDPLVDILRLGDNPEQCIAALEAYVAREPGRALAHYNLGVLFDRIGRVDAAIVQYKRAQQLDDPFGAASYNLAQIYVRASNFNEAEAEARRALEANPSHTRAMNILGVIKTMAGDYAAAARQFENALAILPDDALTRNNLADCLARQGLLSQATSQVSAARRLDPTNEVFKCTEAEINQMQKSDA